MYSNNVTVNLGTNVTDKVKDLMEVNCYALNCFLKLFPRPGLFPKKVFKTKQELNLYLDVCFEKRCGGRSTVEAWISNVIKRVCLFQIHFWDQSHVTIVWNTRETGDINTPLHQSFNCSLTSKEMIWIRG